MLRSLVLGEMDERGPGIDRETVSEKKKHRTFKKTWLANACREKSGTDIPENYPDARKKTMPVVYTPLSSRQALPNLRADTPRESTPVRLSNQCWHMNILLFFVSCLLFRPTKYGSFLQIDQRGRTISLLAIYRATRNEKVRNSMRVL